MRQSFWRAWFCIYYFFVISAERGISTQNQQAVERSVMMLSQEIAAPLAAYDRVSMSVIAEPYVDEPMIAYVGIYDSQGGVLVPLGESAEGYRAEEVVISGDQVLGKVVVQAKTVSRAKILSGNWVFFIERDWATYHLVADLWLCGASNRGT